jgi:putative ABC transport system permease protein
LNSHSLLFAFLVAAISALLCAVLPALSATSIDLSTGLRDTSANLSGSRSAQRFLHSVVTLQAAVCMLLLLNSGLLVRSLVRLMSSDHGLRADHVLTLRLPTGSWDARALNPENVPQRIEHYLRLLEKAQNTAGVQTAALASSLPLSHTVVRTHVAIPGQSVVMPICQSVTGDYFRAMGIPLLAGRSFDRHDSASKLKRAVINEAFAEKYFAGERPVGRFLLDEPDKNRIEIIGVVENSPHLDYSEKVEPEMYVAFDQDLMTPFLTGLIVRTLDDPQQVAKRLRSTLALSDADQPVVRVLTLTNLIQENTWMSRFSAWLFSAFAALALCLAGIGMYGVVAYVTASRRREYGIRLSLGAHPAGLFQLASLQNLRPVLLGISFGALGSYWSGKWIASLLYNTSVFDLLTLLLTFAILFVVALAATAGPALRAARTDPAIALRYE